MSADLRTCPSCGARVPAEADRCDLCGTPVDPSSDDASEEPDADSEVQSRGSESEVESEPGPSVFCNQCGWENPPGARFCSRCGEELQDLSDAAPAGTRPVTADLPTGEEAAEPSESTDPQETDEQAAMGWQIALIVGGALLVVLALFFVTQWSAQQNWSESASTGTSAAQAAPGGGGSASSSSGGRQSMGPAGERSSAPTDLQSLLNQTADSLTASVAGQVDSLRTRIEQASGTEKRRLQSKLVNLLIGAGQPGRAATLQKKIAEATGSVDARRRTADLLYRWMQKLQSEGQRRRVVQVARHAARAYEAVAERKPDDLDARTRMGETYLLTNEPMKGIKAINAVLDDDSTFVPARFQKGLALLQINRLDQAVRQFEAVKRYAEDGSPFYQQADRALKVIEQQRGRASSGTSSSGPTANP